jgi:prepilin-type N-terminal cleavage/methylation domain-containing protein
MKAGVHPIGARAWEYGHTLVELLIVLTIMGVVAFLARPLSEPVRPFRAEAAARDVVQALKFAQAEAQRTGEYLLVKCDVAANSVTLSRLDIGANPPAPDPAIPVLHPLDKRGYKIVFDTSRSTTGVTIAGCAFSFDDGTTVAQLAFAADGEPVNVVGNKPGDVKSLVGGAITLATGQLVRTVAVAAANGRVSLSP